MNMDENKGSTSAPTTRRRGTLLVVVFVVALVTLPVLNIWLTGERQRWAAARIIQRYEAGDQEYAIAAMQETLKNADGNRMLKVQLAGWLLDAGRAEAALQWTSKLWQQFPQDPQEISVFDWFELNPVFEVHFRALVTLKKKDELVKVLRFWEDAHDRHFSATEQWDNDFAYHCALADVNLESAEARMSQRLERLGNESAFGQIQWVIPFQTKSLVASGLVALELNDISFRPLLGSISEKIDELNDEWKAAVLQTRVAALSILQADQLAEDKNQKLLTRLRFDEEKVRRQLLLLLTTQALLLQRTQFAEQVAETQQQIAELGGDINELAAQLPEFQESLSLSDRSSYYLDTLAWVQFRLNRLVEAYDNLDLAILAQEISHKGKTQSAVLQGRSRQSIEKYFYNNDLVTATLYNHRYELHRLANDLAAAKQDQQRIEELGFQVNDPRFN
jgi:hypothetical protein